MSVGTYSNVYDVYRSLRACVKLLEVEDIRYQVEDGDSAAMGKRTSVPVDGTFPREATLGLAHHYIRTDLFSQLAGSGEWSEAQHFTEKVGPD